MAVITLSREKGSGGRRIAEQAAEALGYHCADKDLIIEVARELGVSEAAVEQFDEHEKSSPGIRAWMRDLLTGADPVFTAESAPVFWPTQSIPTLVPASGSNIPGEHILDRSEYLETLNTIINRINQKGNAIIVGRGSQAILANDPDVFHIRIVAPLEIRCERVRAADKIELEEARNLVLDTDRARARYIHERYQMDWADPMMYHMVINTGLCSLDKAIKMLVEAVK